jgi:hypothetical protein
LRGIYNIASLDNIALSQIANMCGSTVEFGKYKYDAGNISNKKVISVFPEFNKSSKDVVEQFLRQRQ